MEERPLKKSEVLAIENIRRIADQIRSERNDALALAQERREQLESSVALLKEAKERLLAGQVDDTTKALVGRIDMHLTAIKF